MIKTLLFLLRSVVLFAAIGTAHAQTCNGTVDDIAFGNAILQPTTALAASSNMTLTCTGGTAGQTVRACVSIPAVGGTLALRRMTSGGQFLTYTLYKDASYTQIWGDVGAAQTPRTVDILLGAGGTGMTTVSVYGRLTSGQTGKAAGSYVDAFTGGNRLSVRTGTTTTNCNTYNGLPNRRITMRVTGGIGQACTLTAAPLSFGAWGNLGVARLGVSNLTVTCALGTPYTVGLDGGGVTGNVAARAMGLGGLFPGVVGYQLYSDAGRSVVWGDAPPVGGTGTGAAQILPIYGRVPVQATPAQGSYSDRITVTITY